MDRIKILALLEEMRRVSTAAHLVLEELGEDDWYIVGTRKSGTLRRASMDLTRALTDLRRRR